MLYYKILELDPGASTDEIVRAYRKLAMKWHPDRNNNSKYAEEKFKEIKQAYEKLSDPSYKYIPPVAKDSVPQAAKHYARTTVVNVVPDATVYLSLDQVETGILSRANKKTICSTCNGSGALYGAHSRTVGQVFGGGGYTPRPSEEDSKLNRCPACKGSGEIIDFDCYFDIPPGVWDNVILKLQCVDQNRRPTGNRRYKNIRIKVEDRVNFLRKGNDLYTNSSIDRITSLEGGSIKVMGLNNKELTVTVPPCSPEGTILRLTGVGLPDLQTREHGNIYITLKSKHF